MGGCSFLTGDVTLSADEATAYVGCGHGNPAGVYAYTVATGAKRSQIALPGVNPHGVALSKDGSTMYVMAWGECEIYSVVMSGADVTGTTSSIIGQVNY